MMRFQRLNTVLSDARAVAACAIVSVWGVNIAYAQTAQQPADLLRGAQTTQSSQTAPGPTQTSPTFPQPLNLEQERRELNPPAPGTSSAQPANGATPSSSQPAQNGLDPTQNQTPASAPTALRLSAPLSVSNPRAQRTTPASPVGELRSDGTITPLANARVQPVQGSVSNAQDDPFAPLGIRAGRFLLFPVLTQTFGTTNNADGSVPGNADSFSTTDFRARLVSDFAVHQLTAEIGGSYQTFFNGTIDDLPRLDGNFEFRYDAARDLILRVGANGSIETQSSDSALVASQTASNLSQGTQETTLGGFLAVEKQTGRLALSLRGTITHQDSQSDNAAANADSSNTFAEARLRAAYDTSAVATPFVEAGLGLRTIQSTGQQDDESRQYTLRGGFQFNRGEKLNGEIGAGYAVENFLNSNDGDLASFTVDGTINWSPIRFTTITATAQTGFDVSNSGGDGNSVVHVGGLSITRDIRQNLSLNARVLASLRTFASNSRQDVTVQTQVGAEWRMNRNLAFFGTLGYENVDSSEDGSSFSATTAQIGLRWQR